MKTISSLDAKASLIAASVAVATVVSVAPAQAIQLSGSMGLSGKLDITNTSNGFIWNFSQNVVNDKFGDFLGVSFAGSSGPRISSLEFNCISAGTMFGVPMKSCTTNPIASFIDFGMQTINGITANLSFNLDAAEYISWETTFRGIKTSTTSASPSITGSLVFNGTTLAVGNFSGGQTGRSSTYQMTLAAVPTSIPEPSTSLGIGLTVGVASLLRRKTKSLTKA